MEWEGFFQVFIHTASNAIFWALADVFMWRSFGMPFQDLGRATLFVSLLSLIFSPIPPQTILLVPPLHILLLLLGMFVVAWYVILGVRYAAVIAFHNKK